MLPELLETDAEELEGVLVTYRLDFDEHSERGDALVRLVGDGLDVELALGVRCQGGVIWIDEPEVGPGREGEAVGVALAELDQALNGDMDVDF